MSAEISIKGRYFSSGVDELADGANFDIDPADARLNALEIHSFLHGASCDVVYLKDTGGNGTYNVSITIDSLSGEGISQANQVEIGENARELLRITNTSGGAADFAVTGYEVSQ